jgi:hypothetical protein
MYHWFRDSLAHSKIDRAAENKYLRKHSKTLEKAVLFQASGVVSEPQRGNKHEFHIY